MMANLPTTMAAFLFVLGIIIFVHELGHFAVAKLFGIRVFIFSFGFGKRLLGVKRGETDYRLSLVPLGGYVKLEGEPDDALSEDTSARGDGRDFLSRPRWQRFLVYVAGPAMNVALTVSLLWGLHVIGFGEPSSLSASPVIGAVDPDLPGAQAGLEPGDEILSIDGERTGTWFDVIYRTRLSPSRSLRLVYRRGEASHEIEIRPAATGAERMGTIGVHPMVHILAVSPGAPAAAAGLMADDAILAIDGRPIRTAEDVAPAIGASRGRAAQMRIHRAGRIRDLAVTPRDDGGVPRIGVTVGERLVVRKYGPVQAVGVAFRRTGEMTRQIFDVLGRLLTGRVSVRSMAGPVGIARESGNAARQGGLALFGFVAFISLNVGVLNLFPLTPLDGGHMLLLAAEGTIRRDLSLRVKTWIMNTGAAMLFALIALVLYADLSKTSWLGRFLP
jgi:regulator of sigma E protease